MNDGHSPPKTADIHRNLGSRRDGCIRLHFTRRPGGHVARLR